MNIARRPFVTAIKNPLVTTSVFTAALLGAYKQHTFSHASNLSTTTTMSSPFLDAVKTRRSIYALTPTSPIPDARVHEIVNEAMLTVPTAFNSQPLRVAVLLNAEHKKFWASASTATRSTSTDEGHVQRSLSRIAGFDAGSATLLFFTDAAQLAQSRSAIPAYGHFFAEWAQHSQGMLQFALWTALEAEGFGASLQHYQFLGDEFVAGVRETYGLPKEWELVAQLVLGGKADAKPLEAKEKKDVKDTVRVFGEQ